MKGRADQLAAAAATTSAQDSCWQSFVCAMPVCEDKSDRDHGGDFGSCGAIPRAAGAG